MYQGLKTLERRLAELVKGLGEPVKDLIEDLSTKGGKNQGHECGLCIQGDCRGVKERLVEGGRRGQNCGLPREYQEVNRYPLEWGSRGKRE